MINFYKNPSGNYTSHMGGLTETQIEFLQALKPGDRLIGFMNTDKRISSSDLTIKYMRVNDSKQPAKDVE